MADEEEDLVLSYQQIQSILDSIEKNRFNPSTHIHDDECMICMDKYTRNDMVAQLKCDVRHYFHSDCVEKWVA